MDSLPFRVPTIHRRFVTRAAYLQKHGPFLTALAATRRTWDAHYPTFRIGRPGLPPERPCHPVSICPVPPRLMQLDRRLGMHAGDREDTSAAEFEWRMLVIKLCATWWPAADFPFWLDAEHHPAMWFVAGCLIWRPASVFPDVWMKPRPLAVHTTTMDPRRPENGPDVADWRARYHVVAEALIKAADAEASLDETRVTAILLDAVMAGRSARLAATPDPADWVRFVPIVPGMTGRDWRGSESSVMHQLDESITVEPLQQRARRLHTDGRSKRAIARELGLSRRALDRLFDE